jgi:putative ABC transport system permease protein
MMTRVAFRNVMRHRLRTAFTVLALSMAVALLADMLMLSRGMEKTFYRVLSSVGYEVRVCPRGTLPFATDAVIDGSSRIVDAVRADARVERSLRVLGTTLHVDSIPLFAMGVEGERQSLYRVVDGHDVAGEQRSQGLARVHPGLTRSARPRGPRPVPPARASLSTALAATRAEQIVLNQNAMRALHVAIGDTLTLQRDAPGATMAFSRGLTAVVTGTIDIPFDLPGQRTAILPLDAVQQLRREGETDAASFVLVKLKGSDDAHFVPLDEQRAVAASLAATFPDLSVYAMDELMDALQRQLAYFKQFSRILSTISLLVTFLLVAVVLTIGAGERRGEIAALRSMGFRRRSIQTMILAESALLLAMSAVIGSVLGWFLAGYLDRILTQSPSLPAGYRFFIPAWREILTAVALSGVAGILAALLPAIQAARVDIPKTLHEEVV